MIIRNEILNIAANKHLNPFVIEKDYVLGWLLAGMSLSPKMKEILVFKGGTCLKKCYFETYRSSEDLDFTVQRDVIINEKILLEEFSKIVAWVSENSGIEMPENKIVFSSHRNPKGNISFQGKIHYRGPISPSSKYSMPKIKLDITVDEIIVNSPVLTRVNHEFDDIKNEITIFSYSYVEVFAEKIRALKERTRPRDLYDVINFYRRPESYDLASEVKRILQKKCIFKNIDFPKIEDVMVYKEKCEQGWRDQLEHQIPILPSFLSFWEELEDFFFWLNGNSVKSKLLPIFLENEEKKLLLSEANMPEFHFSTLHLIQFAAVNRLCVEIYYKDNQRKELYDIVVLEPYSLRFYENKVLLYGIDHQNDHEIKSIEVKQINKIKVLTVEFKPIYQIDFLPKLISPS